MLFNAPLLFKVKNAKCKNINFSYDIKPDLLSKECLKMKNIFFALKNLPFCPRMSADQIYLQIFLLNASLYNLRCPDWALVQEFRQWVFFVYDRTRQN